MKPTQGKCEDCRYSTIDSRDKLYCYKLATTLEGWWTGCVMWEDKSLPKEISVD
jgi:hypothetical protein